MLRGNPAFAEALKQLKAGDLQKLRVKATTFIQRDTPNRNFVRFKPGMMPTFGKSFEGQPFLRDHASRTLDARGGTIVDSKLVHNEDGSKHIEMELELVKPWAMEGVLDGTIDRFSIGWSRTAPVECSIHEASISKCDCWPGDKMADGRVAEFVFTGAEGTEVSAVNVPAVVGTGISAISQLGTVDRADLLCMLIDNEPEDHVGLSIKIITALSLAADASDDAITLAVERMRDELAIAKDQTVAAKAELVTLQTKQATIDAAANKAKTDARVSQLVQAGKLKPGSASETALRAMAGRDQALFETQVADMLESGPRVTPVGAQLKVPEGDKLPEQGLEELDENPHLKGFLRRAGITLDQYKKHGQGARDTLAQRREAGY